MLIFRFRVPYSSDYTVHSVHSSVLLLWEEARWDGKRRKETHTVLWKLLNRYGFAIFCASKLKWARSLFKFWNVCFFCILLRYKNMHAHVKQMYVLHDRRLHSVEGLNDHAGVCSRGRRPPNGAWNPLYKLLFRCFLHKWQCFIAWISLLPNSQFLNFNSTYRPSGIQVEGIVTVCWGNSGKSLNWVVIFSYSLTMTSVFLVMTDFLRAVKPLKFWKG